MHISNIIPAEKKLCTLNFGMSYFHIINFAPLNLEFCNTIFRTSYSKHGLFFIQEISHMTFNIISTKCIINMSFSLLKKSIIFGKLDVRATPTD